MNHRGKLVVVSGFSGTGKGTLMKEMLKTFPDKYVVSISMTTRDPRGTEKDGVDYFFVTNEEFEREIERDGFLEHAGYVNHYYGTPRKFVQEKRESGLDVFLEIEVQGALQIKKKYPEALLVFIITKDAATLEKRLVSRQTEDAKTVTKRLEQALKEACYVPEYDYLHINDDIGICAKGLHHIIQTEPEELRMREENVVFVQKFSKDLEAIIAKRKQDVL